MQNETSRAFSVGQINQYLHNLMAEDAVLRSIMVRGEVSNCKYHRSGHIYFSLKDESGVLPCVMYASNVRSLRFSMKDGDKVLVRGSIDVYQRGGYYQLIARNITQEGVGDLLWQFEQRKRELAEMGMFSEEYKKPIPAYAFRIGVVTAPTGAAIRDIIQIARRRNPYVQLILCPALVQGEAAAESIASGIRRLDALGLDVLIVGRGGGSIEDLWAFNEEVVARAIFACNTPVISAVGHEIDWTIADYVADQRAPTPSAAAELAVFDVKQVQTQLASYQGRMRQAMRNAAAEASRQLMTYQDRMHERWHNRVADERALLKHYQRLLSMRNPRYQLEQNQQRVADLMGRLSAQMQQQTERAEHRLAMLAARLEERSPARKLAGGYAFLTDPAGHKVTTVSRVHPGDPLLAQVTDGEICAVVSEVRPRPRNMES